MKFIYCIKPLYVTCNSFLQFNCYEVKLNTKTFKICLFVLVLIVIVVLGVWQNDSLERNHKLANARIYEIQTSSKGGGAFVKFTYQIGQKELSNSTPINIRSTKEYQFLYALLKGITLPIIYQANEPSNSKMLFTYKEYVKYKISVPFGKEYILNSIDSLVND
jgi:hypothetical protein